MGSGLVVSKIGAFYHPTMGFLMGLGTTLVWWAGGRQILAGTMSIGDLTMFLSYMWQFIGPVQELSRMNERFIRAATSAERVFQLLDTTPDIAGKADTIHLNEIKGEIEFK